MIKSFEEFTLINERHHSNMFHAIKMYDNVLCVVEGDEETLLHNCKGLLYYQGISKKKKGEMILYRWGWLGNDYTHSWCRISDLEDESIDISQDDELIDKIIEDAKNGNIDKTIVIMANERCVQEHKNRQKFLDILALADYKYFQDNEGEEGF